MLWRGWAESTLAGTLCRRPLRPWPLHPHRSPWRYFCHVPLPPHDLSTTSSAPSPATMQLCLPQQLLLVPRITPPSPVHA
jgi:hypothetical protein